MQVDEPARWQSSLSERATLADSGRIAALVSELGYPTSIGQMQRRLEVILDDDDFDTLVAVEDGDVVGFTGSRGGPLYEDDGLVGHGLVPAVASDHQRRGVGRILLGAAESRLAGRGARVLVVTSGNHRTGAHAFYERCGCSFTGRRNRESVAMKD